MIRIAAAVAFLATTLCSAALAQTSQEYGDDVYRPRLGQTGKDVIWIPTPDSLVTRMLTAAKVTKDDLVYDLGAGDGKIPIAAARDFGAKAVGIEYNPDMAELARRNAKRANVDGTVKIITGDIFAEDFSSATVVTMYLLPELNLKLRPIILKMKPGTRVVSHAFHMGDWEPDEQFAEFGRDAYLWYVPANVEGVWTFKEDGGSMSEGTVAFAQRYQRIGGSVSVAGKSQPMLAAALRGDDLRFAYVDADQNLRTAHVKVSGNTFEGTLSLHGAVNMPVKGVRRPPPG
jgi:SAM-dependent methyltransferase